MQDLNKQEDLPQASGRVVGLFYESFVPGVWHRWMEKEILWFCFRRAEPEDVGSISFSRKVFAGTEDPPACIGPVRGLRPLSVSRVNT